MTTTAATLEFGRLADPRSAAALLVALVAAVAVVGWREWRSRAGQPAWVRAALAALRVAALGVLGWAAFDPRLRRERTESRPPRVAVLVDDSRSMRQADGGVPRRDRLSRLLSDDWRERLAAGRNVVAWGFSRTATRLDELAVPAGAGPESRLGDALLALIRDEPNLAAVVVLTDGRSTGGEPTEAAIAPAKRRGIAVHAVGFGADAAPPNRRVAEVRMPAKAMRGDPVKVAATVLSTGLPADRFPVEFLLVPAGKEGPVAKLGAPTVAPPADGTPTVAEASFTPTTAGRWTVTARAPADARETDPADNAAVADVEVLDAKTNVLLVAGGPSHEFQFLRNLLLRDATAAPTVLLQTTEDAPPTSLATFDAVVTLDADWTKLPPAFRAEFVEWLERQAGGWIHVAGPSHGAALAADPALEAIRRRLPVELEAPLDERRRPATEPRTVALTNEGRRREALWLDDEPEASLRRWADAPGWFVAGPARRARPGAAVLATVAGNEGSVPAIAQQFVGSGRATYVGSAELWRWRGRGEGLHERLWVRLLRDAAEGRLWRGGGRGALVAEPARAPLGAEIALRATVLDAAFRPVAAESLAVAVEGTAETVRLERVPEAPGQYAGRWRPAAAGARRLLLAPPGGGTLEARVEIAAADPESLDVRRDRPALRRLAEATGGRFWEPVEADGLPAALPDRPTTVVVALPPEPLWDGLATLLLTVALLAAEWTLRKRRRLP